MSKSLPEVGAERAAIDQGPSQAVVAENMSRDAERGSNGKQSEQVQSKNASQSIDKPQNATSRVIKPIVQPVGAVATDQALTLGSGDGFAVPKNKPPAHQVASQVNTQPGLQVGAETGAPSMLKKLQDLKQRIEFQKSLEKHEQLRKLQYQWNQAKSPSSNYLQGTQQQQQHQQPAINQQNAQQCGPSNPEAGAAEPSQIAGAPSHAQIPETKAGEQQKATKKHHFINQNRASLQNLKQNQNLFLSLQSPEDKRNRWKYTLLVLDSVLQQLSLVTACSEQDIDFVQIAESLPKLTLLESDDKNGPKTATAGQAAEALAKKSSQGQSQQRMSIQPRICSKLWEALRKSLKESFKMEHEFYDHTRKEIIQNYQTEALAMFKKRLGVYLENQDLLTIKQRDFNVLGRQFVEQELRAQRLIDFYCEMCEKAEQNGLTSRSKVSFAQIGQSLQEELQKEDRITKEEEQMIIDGCDQIQGMSGVLYNQLDQVLMKIIDEVKVIDAQRDKEIIKPAKVEWSQKEIAQLLIAVFNLGEGEWFEIQKRIDFSSSGWIKTPNQIAHRWRKIKRIMNQDIQSMLKKSNGTKLITVHQWILSTLGVMAQQDPELGIEDHHLKVLEAQLFVNPNEETTPYQRIIGKFQKEQQIISEQRAADRQRRMQKEIQEKEALNNTAIPEVNSSDILGPIKIMLDDVVKEQVKKTLGTKETHSQRFLDENAAQSSELNTKIMQKRFLKFQEKHDESKKNSQLAVSPKPDMDNQITIDLNNGENPKKQSSNQRVESIMNGLNKVKVSNFNNLSHGSSGGNVKQLGISSGHQKSSIHDIYPGKQPFTEKANQYGRISSQIIGGDRQHNHTDGPKIITQATQQTIQDEGTKQITINNNINITTIHNVSGGPEQRVPTNFSSTNLLNQNLINDNITRMTMNKSATVYDKQRKANNLNLLLQNPLSQIQAPSNENTPAVANKHSQNLGDFTRPLGMARHQSLIPKSNPILDKKDQVDKRNNEIKVPQLSLISENGFEHVQKSEQTVQTPAPVAPKPSQMSSKQYILWKNAQKKAATQQNSQQNNTQK